MHRVRNRGLPFGIAGLVLVAGLGGKPATAQVSTEEAQRWREDLGQLVGELAERHVDLYRTMTQEAFDRATGDLYEKIPGMERHQILVGFSQLVAMVGDGHTSFLPADQSGKEFDYFPLRLWDFEDGIHVIATLEEHSSLLGRKLQGIDGVPIEEIKARLASTISADNPMELDYTVPAMMIRPEVLQALEVTGSTKKATFSFAGGPEATLAAVEPNAFDRGSWVSANPLYEGKAPPRMMLNFLFATPLMLEHAGQGWYYWFTYLEESKALFFQYNTCWDEGSANPLAKALEDFFRLLDEKPVERVIIDIRQNSGGEPMTAAPLIEGLAARKELAQEGRLFVLTGRRTFSAAVTNAADLRRLAGARLVGEPPRGKPNHPSEGRDIVLERTGVVATVSTQLLERDPELGDRPFLPIDIPVASTWDAFEAARDAVLEAALAADLGTGR